MPAAEPGRTRTCPHCKSTILDSADVCPACNHHLRFGADAGSRARAQSLFSVDGTVRAAPGDVALEYEIVVVVYDENEREVARKLVNVGALRGNASRRCVVSVNGYPAAVQKPPADAPVQRLASAIRRRT